MIYFTDRNTFVNEVRQIVNPKIANGMHCNLSTLAGIRHELIKCLPATKTWHCRYVALEVVANHCSKSKYTTQPQKQKVHITPIPSYAGEVLQIDVFSTEKE